ncbi:MAG TPA: beta-ketoacyl synthase N-terminal-like domain-containing protein [Polyangiaceae bacterium]|nr:beta-ketoacyl synthase N-terminal-like domain-containing protein [Polyangiaceae bacterium]
MKSVAIVAAAAESALGSGRDAYGVGAVGDVPRSRIVEDATLRSQGFAKPWAGRAPALSGLPADVDPAEVLLDRVACALVADLDAWQPSWRHRRIGVVVGTSSGGMISLSRALRFRRRGEPVPGELAASAPYFGPLRALLALGVTPLVQAQVLAACASSGAAIGVASRWLWLGRVDLVIAGGYDAVGDVVASGFESLGATTSRPPAPFRKGRDGMALGEGAALVALVTSEISESAIGYVRGFGMASDASHVTAPDPAGAGLVRAARAAFDDAHIEPGDVELVSAHATATQLNDGAEAHALTALLGERGQGVVVHPLKAVIGHTLGASSVLETLAALDAMKRGVKPAAAGSGEVDEAFRCSLLEQNEAGNARTCLKLSAAFGGANAALVLSTEPGAGHALHRRHVTVVAAGEPRVAADLAAIAAETKLPRAAVSRLDPLSAAVVAAAASALGRAPPLARERMGVVVGTAAATLELDAAFDERLRDRGPRGVDPRKFPATSPNLCAGNCTIAFGLLGPSLSVGAGPDADIEALIVGFDLVASGDADSVLVVAAEQVGGVVRELWAAMGLGAPEDGAAAVILGRSVLDDGQVLAATLRARELRGTPGWDSVVRRGWPAFLAALGLPGTSSAP